MEFVEREGEIVSAMTTSDANNVQDTCSTWGNYTQPIAQDDSGI
jgi:hypothetical protein